MRKRSEKEMWVRLATGDVISCSDDRDVWEVLSSLCSLYQMAGRDDSVIKAAPAPCFVIFEDDKHIFTKRINKTDSIVIPSYEFSLS